MKKLLLVAGMLGVMAGANAATFGQTDTFEDGTTQGWIVGLLGAPHPAPPVNVPDGGPDGAGDNYLLLTAVGGGGPGNRLSAINPSAQWAGDYTSGGITTIAMDVNNFGNSDLALRLLFADPLSGPPNNLAFSSEAVAVPAGSGWISILFPITAESLTAGLGSVDTALANATEVRVFHSAADTFPGESIVAQLGIDNIQATAATAVPEGSSTIVLLSCGLLSMAMCKRRR